MPFEPSYEELEAIVTHDNNQGWCRNCGEEVYGIEPDFNPDNSPGFKCEGCGEVGTTYGAEEFLAHGWIEDFDEL